MNIIQQPTISAIIPAYNAARYVGRAIESVLAQTYPVQEVFVIDDGSVDDTAEVIAQYGSQVHLIRQENAGPGAARNRGARQATGEWLALLDADDRWLPHKLERQVPWTQNSQVGIVQGWQGMPDNEPPSDITFTNLWERNWIANSSVMIRRSAFEAVGGFDEDRALIAVEDYNLWLRIAAKGWKIKTCHEKLVEYESAPNHLSSQLERATRAEFVNVENIARRLGMEKSLVAAKRLSICERQGKHLLYHREMRVARELLRVPLQTHPTPLRLLRWLATFAPPSLLDFQRKRNSALQYSEAGQEARPVS